MAKRVQRKQAPQEEFRLLSEEQCNSLIAAIPSHALENPGVLYRVVQEVERAREDLWQAHHLGVTNWATREELGPARSQLEELRNCCYATLRAFRDLGPLAGFLLTGVPPASLDNQLVPQALQSSRAWCPAADIDHALSSLDSIKDAVSEAIHGIRMTLPPTGRPVAVSERALVWRLYGVWQRLGCSVIRDNRGARTKWPFGDFVRAVGATVVPGFTGEAAARAVTKHDRLMRRRCDSRDKKSPS